MGPDGIRGCIVENSRKGTYSGVFGIWVDFPNGFLKQGEVAGHKKSLTKARYMAVKGIICTLIFARFGYRGAYYGYFHVGDGLYDGDF